MTDSRRINIHCDGNREIGMSRPTHLADEANRVFVKNCPRMLLTFVKSSARSALSIPVVAIVLRCADEQMSGINARWVIAMMASIQRERIDMVMDEIGYPVRPIAAFFYCDKAVSVLIAASLPFPASSRIASLKFGPRPPQLFIGKYRYGNVPNSHCESLLNRFELWLGSFGCFRIQPSRLYFTT